MVPLELDDPGADPPSVPRQRRRRRWWLLAAAAGVVPLLVAGQWVANELQRAAWERLADRTQVLSLLGTSLGPLWTVDSNQMQALGEGAAWRGSVVTELARADGSVAVVSIDGRDGRHRWTTSLTQADPARAAYGRDVRPVGSCQRVPDDAAVVACVLTGAIALAQGQEVVTPPGSTSAPRLVVLEARDGRVRSDHRLSAQMSDVATMLPGGLVVLGPSVSTSGAEVVGLDLGSGVERWRTPLPMSSQGWHGGFQTGRAGDGVAVIAGSVLTVIGPDGTVRLNVPVDGTSGLYPIQDGRVAVLVSSGTLVVGGKRDLRLDGAPVTVPTDDGSLPGVVFTRKDVLRAFGPDGSLLWQSADVPSDGLIVLHGVVYVMHLVDLVAIDGATGRTRWTTDLTVPDVPVLTDGRVLLAPRNDEVLALDPSTGVTVWRSPLPAGHLSVGVVNGLLLATSPRGEDAVVLG